MSTRAAIPMAVLALAPLSAAWPQARVSDTAEVRTAATATRSVRPDRSSFTLQFTADGPTPELAGQHLAARADSVRQALAALGIPRDSITTGSRWYWWRDRIQVLTSQHLIPATPPSRGYQAAIDTIHDVGGGWRSRPIMDTTYRASEILEVRAGDPARVGPAIDAVLSLRITSISGISFGVSDPRAVQLELLREATARVTEQAAAIAEAGGGRLGRVLYLGTQAPDAYAERYGYESISLRGAEVTSSGTEITAPAVAVSMTVYGRWQLLRR
jgi:uncharacterized protein YggE